MHALERFGRALRARARELDLADAEVARRVGLSQSRYANYVMGIRQPDFDTLLKICQVLDSSPDELLGYRPRQPASDEDDMLRQRIMAAALLLETVKLRIAATVLDALAKAE